MIPLPKFSKPSSVSGYWIDVVALIQIDVLRRFAAVVRRLEGNENVEFVLDDILVEQEPFGQRAVQVLEP